MQKEKKDAEKKKKMQKKKNQYICKAIINPKSSNCYDSFFSPI